ncbi:hypothetical protein HAX54_022155 [Datura stramonium]|uniref:Uncharacterized protein n=1 Tax=Datura stramonium TaxID=4076 RepID=A0ABS8UU21_DATST|nr:hypothetical protein [Datura stramonium]
MAPKVNKGKGVASSIHGSKRARRPSEEEHEVVSMAPPPFRNFLSLVFPQMVDRILTIALGFMFNAPGDCNLNMVREFLEIWIPNERSNQVKIIGQIIEFSPKALNRLLGKPIVDPQPFVDMELEAIKGPVLTVNEHNARIDNMLSHLYSMQMLQLRKKGVTEEQLHQLNIDYPLREHLQALCRVGPGYEEPLDDDVSTED